MYRKRAINQVIAVVMASVMILGVNTHNILADTIDNTFIDKEYVGQDMIISFVPLGTDVSYQVVPHGTEVYGLNLPTSLYATIISADNDDSYLGINLDHPNIYLSEFADFSRQLPDFHTPELPGTVLTEAYQMGAEIEVPTAWEVTGVILTYAEDDTETELAFNGFVAGMYSFTAVMPFGFVLAEGVVLPQITVVVASIGIMPAISGLTDLQDAIAAAPTDGTPTTITLTGNITLGSALTIDQNRNIILDGNGFTITQTTTGQRHFNVGASAASIGTLTLRDVTLSGGTMTAADRLVAGFTGTANRGGVVVNIGSSLVVESAIIENNRAAGAGGINSSGTVTLLSGAIIRHNTGGMGGGVYTSTGAAVTHMHPGSYISHNSATHAGGIGGMGLLEMHGGTISFNRAAANGAGGGIMAWTSRAGSPALIMHDGLIEGNLAQVGGGIAFLGTSAAAANENAITSIIHNGQIINNGRMTGFADTVQGGGIFLQGWARLTIHDVTISGNFASGGGGGIMASSGAAPAGVPPITTLNIIEGLIDDNASGASGGGIMLTSSTTNAGSAVVTLGADVTVSNNNAPNGSGGGIAMANITDINTAMLTINGSTIRGNTAGASGGGIAVWPSPRQALNMPSGFIQRNTGLNGGGIFAGDLPSITIGSSVIFSCNVATNGAVRPPATLPANVATTSSTIFNHALNNFDINLTGTMITDLVMRFYTGANGDFASPNAGDAHVERIIPVTAVCDPPPLVVPGIDADSGWTHTGWRQNDIVNAPLLSDADIVALDIRDNISFTAQYSSGNFTATFDLNGAAGTAPSSQTVGFGAYLIEPTPAPTRENHNFMGWNVNQNGSGANWDFTTNTMPGNNITLYAQWQLMTRTVTFNPNGGSVSGSNTRTVPHGSNIASLASPNDTLPGVSFNVASTGWNFVEWRTAQPTAANNTLGTVFDANTAVTANQTVYARWNTDVTFLGNGGIPATYPVTQKTDTTDIIPGTTFGQLAPPAPTRTSWTFGGWYTESAGGTQLAAADVVVPNAQYHARWNTIVTFDHNFTGGPADITRQVRGSSSDVTTPSWPANPTRPGHNFVEWNTEQNGTGTVFTDTTTVPGAITVYAQWQVRQYTVSFDLNGGNLPVPGSQTLDFGTLITEPTPHPTRNGYNFMGWNTAQNGTGVNWNFATDTMPEGSFTLYARWQAQQYTVTFDLNGGVYAGNSGLLSQSIPHGGNATLLTQNPTRIGYIFDGWTPALNLNNITENRTFMALWKPGAYEVVVIAPSEPGVEVTIIVDGAPSDGSNISPGSSVSIEISRPGFRFSRWTITGLPEHILDSIEDLTFTMPNATVSVAISTDGSVRIEVVGDDGQILDFIYFEMPPGNLVFHPHWAGDIRAVGLGATPNIDAPYRLNAISGTGYEIRQHVEVGQRVYLYSPGNRPGYIFDGWEAVNPLDLVILPSNSHFFIMPDIGSVGFGFEYIEVRALWRASGAVTPPGNGDGSGNNNGGNNYNGGGDGTNGNGGGTRNNTNQHIASPTVHPTTIPLTEE